jgi:hypothetical protein
MNILFFPHQGIGDQIIMNGCVHFFRETLNPSEIKIIMKKNYSVSTLKHLYADYPSITFYEIQSDSDSIQDDPFIRYINNKPFGFQVELDSKQYQLANFGSHSQNPHYEIPGRCWADAFYMHAGIDPSVRFRMFQLPSDMSKSKEKYRKLLEKIGTNQYILVVDDPSRNRNIDTRLFHSILDENKSRELPVISLGFNRYSLPLQPDVFNVDASDILETDSILNYSDILQYATECHMVDSSLACLLDVLPLAPKHIYLHMYATNPIEIPKVHIGKQWTYIYNANEYLESKNKTQLNV